MKKTYLVTGTFQYEVIASDVAEAEIIAAEHYMKNPDTDYTVTEIDEFGCEKHETRTTNGVLEIESDRRNGYKA